MVVVSTCPKREEVSALFDQAIAIQQEYATPYDISEKVTSWIKSLLSIDIRWWFKDFEDAVMQAATNVTLRPHLRTEADNLAARKLIKSHIYFYSSVVGSVLNFAYGIDNESLFSAASISRAALLATIWWYGASDGNYMLHQMTHCRLTTKKTAEDILHFTTWVMTWHTGDVWWRGHLKEHHSWSGNSFFWEIDKDTKLINRENFSWFLQVLLQYDIKNSLKVLFNTPAHMIANIRKPEYTLTTPQETINAAIDTVKKAGYDIWENGEDIIMDTEFTINYRKSIMRIWASYLAQLWIIVTNPFYALYYGLIITYTKCTDYMNHVKPDGSGIVKWMINLSKYLPQNVLWFGAHRTHHDFPWLHPEYSYAIEKNNWLDWKIPDDHIEISDVMPWGKKNAITSTTWLAIKERFHIWKSKQTKSA